MNRRNFLTGAGVAYIMAMSRTNRALAQPNRKEIFIGGRKVTVVDINAHCHFQEVAPIIQIKSKANSDPGAKMIMG
ncbi:MAG: hypothetical protein VX225_04225, partial [Pseudomonadota bacterium]|nr:hypothetical protein [Pseudomonadota bacterium]